MPENFLLCLIDMALAPWEGWTPEEMAEWEAAFGTADEIESKQVGIEQEGMMAMVYLKEGEEWNGRDCGR